MRQPLALPRGLQCSCPSFGAAGQFMPHHRHAAGTEVIECLSDTVSNPILPDTDDVSDDDRLGEPVSRNEQVRGVPESHDQESSPGASRDNALSPTRRTVGSRYELRNNPAPLTRLRDHLV
ncbi:hypothetical protein NDU88_003056 [Pleurodeles waltl]|uniref:Uncharacterized protein n=1 Tax=Pleurodeles waltl TaxID=8319 RepID=A0AAV7WRZ6_PLEWA|nr:hypothetical protein NDU88_003056 [Pleurodeles waltl]